MITTVVVMIMIISVEGSSLPPMLQHLAPCSYRCASSVVSLRSCNVSAKLPSAVEANASRAARTMCHGCRVLRVGIALHYDDAFYCLIKQM